MPLRQLVDESGSRLLRLLLAGLRPEERLAIRTASRELGWDSRAWDNPATHGPLAQVSDRALAVLVFGLSDWLRILELAARRELGTSRIPRAELDAALEELRAALAG